MVQSPQGQLVCHGERNRPSCGCGSWKDAVLPIRVPMRIACCVRQPLPNTKRWCLCCEIKARSSTQVWKQERCLCPCRSNDPAHSRGGSTKRPKKATRCRRRQCSQDRGPRPELYGLDDGIPFRGLCCSTIVSPNVLLNWIPFWGGVGGPAPTMPEGRLVARVDSGMTAKASSAVLSTTVGMINSGVVCVFGSCR